MTTDDARAARPAATSADPRAELLLVGEPARREGVVVALEELGARVVGVDDVELALRRVGKPTAAILCVDPGAPQRILAQLRGAGSRGTHEIPVLLLLERGALPDERAGLLYGGGATAVLEWPTESLLLPQLVRELLGGGIDRPGGPNADADDREHHGDDAILEQALRARLRADSVLAGAIEVRVLGVTAVLRGTVESAWERSRAARLVESVPGIARVVDHRVTVRTAEVPDAELQGTVDATVRSAGNVEARQMRADVFGGVATVSGTAAARSTVVCVCNSIRQVPGIRRVYESVRVTEEDDGPVDAES